jgi:RHH-type proline utilization regulon transcriptional repressor/proline dehydrogenase/delta 1-pyrroline-5-carboxylate dehydrogenase
MRVNMSVQTSGDPAGYDDSATLGELTGLADAASDIVRRWLAKSAEIRTPVAANRLAMLLRAPDGLAFTVRFIDGVIRPEDPRVAARALSELAAEVPASLPRHLRVAIRLGAATGTRLPQVVVPVARRVLRRMVRHLVIDARPRQLGRAIARIRRNGQRLNINLLGEAVLGEREAARRLEGTHRLLARDDVDYVSIKVSATVAPESPWAFDEAVIHVVASLTPLFRRALASRPSKFINLDMEEYRDLDLTIAVFMAVLDQDEFLGLEAGIVLQAYLPDALAAMMRLQDWSAARRDRGGAPIKVRLVKGANLPMERVDAALHNWPLATWGTKQATDTNYKRVLDYAMHPERVRNVRLGVAGHNLFDVAFAWLLAGQRGVEAGVDFEMLLGMAPGQAEVVRRDVGGLLVYTPVVAPNEFDVAISYLVRRLEEGASSDNFMSAVFDVGHSEALFAREEQRFRASLTGLDRTIPPPSRVQHRGGAIAGAGTTTVRNVPDTDPALPANRAWSAAVLSRVAASTIGAALVEATSLQSADDVDAVLASAVRAGAGWGATSARERARCLRDCAAVLERRRGELLEVMAAETGKTLDQGDSEVSEAIDFANYYATLAEALERVDGATHRPVRLTVVTPPWNFPVSIPAGSTLAALAAGSAVVLKPAPQAGRCAAVLAEALWEAGIPREVLHLAQAPESDLGRQLVADARVDRVILTGAYETAELFGNLRADLHLLAETSGKNAIIVTPSADLDLAVKDVVVSAFAHAGQKCSAASLVILVGAVNSSRRFRQQLIDAVTSLKVGFPDDPTSQVGPLISPADGKLLRALTTLDPGEQWLVTPRRLDDLGKLWSPGVKDGVVAGSESHLREFFGPVLGIMAADSLEQAIALQNQVEYGLTAGLHSLDRDELTTWLRTVQAGNLYVNRSITGAIVGRQPFGGWKKSAVGAGAKAGGPNYLIGLSDWQAEPSHATAGVPAGPAALLAVARTEGLGGVDGLERALHSDAAAWRDEFSNVTELGDLEVERNLFRYAPHPVTIRHTSATPLVSLLRVAAAGVLAGAPLTVSTREALPTAIESAFSAAGIEMVIDDANQWVARIRNLQDARIRLLDSSAAELYAAVGARADIAVYAQPVTEAGRIELLPFLREQSVSITAHRFGTLDDLSAGVVEGPGEGLKDR